MDIEGKLEDIARDVSNVRVAVARIEEQLVRLTIDVDELDEIDERIDFLEEEVGRAKAWSAGAVAATAAICSAVAWWAANI
jgi:uncharacterized small protein (DUF1192 family)